MKRLLSILLCALLISSMCVSAAAAPPLVVDEADLLSDWEVSELESKAQALSESYGMDVVILTVWSLDGKTSDYYAQDYYTENLYGQGSDYSGVMLLLSMEYRDWAIITCGDGNFVLTDYGIESIFSDISGYLAQDAYYDAFDTWLDELVRYFEAYEDGEPIDGFGGFYDGPGSYNPIEGDDHIYYDEPAGFGDYVKAFLIALVIGLVVAGITLLVMRGKMNTARQQHGAASYLCQGTYDLHRHQDIFLYSQVSKVRRSNESSGGGGGGSTVRSGGGGRSFGGGGGKF